MEIGFPILLIVTNQECPHCTKMRGPLGWPSSHLDEKSIPPRKDGTLSKWDEIFFKSALTGGVDDDIQRTRIIELNFDKLSSKNNLAEVTFFDLSSKKSKLVIKKYRSDNYGNTILLKKNDNGFIDSKELSIKFNDFIEKYIPLELIRYYINVFPSFIYVHSTIWDNVLIDPEGGSLYARVQGFKTVRDGDNPRLYKVLKDKKSIVEERNRNPIDVLRKLIAFNLEPLQYPSDH